MLRMDVIARQEAKRRSLKQYFTGRPCRNGHIAPRLVGSADCVVCSAARSARWAADRIDQEKARKARHYKENKKRIIARSAAYKAAHPERVKNYKRKYDNSPRAKEKRKRFVYEHRDEMRQYLRAYNEEHFVRIKNAKRQYQIIHPEVHRATASNRRARERAAPGRFTPDDILHLHRKQKYQCAICSRGTSEDYQVDHVVALSRGGTNWPENLQILCPRCNRQKHAMDLSAFLARRAAK